VRQRTNNTNGYCDCKKCGFLTNQQTKTVIKESTTISTGEEEIKEECKHCGHKDSYTKVIPPKSRSQNNSGGSNSHPSSYGGGTTSGGGSGGSW
jgi:uncharacterized protein